MNETIKSTLIRKINQSIWWHVSPRDTKAYKKRGKFLASTYHQAEFYGRPNDVPCKVKIINPMYGFTEEEILMQLFPSDWEKLILSDGASYEDRITLDARMYCKAKALGYDAIVLIGRSGRKSLMEKRKPYSIELNLLHP